MRSYQPLYKPLIIGTVFALASLNLTSCYKSFNKNEEKECCNPVEQVEEQKTPAKPATEPRPGPKPNPKPSPAPTPTIDNKVDTVYVPQPQPALQEPKDCYCTFNIDLDSKKKKYYGKDPVDSYSNN